MTTQSTREETGLRSMPGGSTNDLSDERLLTVNEVANLLQCSVRNVYKLLERNEIPRPLKIGSLTRWRLSALRWWLSKACPVG